jgi:probable rRNA maturation factor
MIVVQIPGTPSPEFDSALLERAAEEALRTAPDSPKAGLTILLTDDVKLRQLNRQYLGIDETTDVLSFPAGYTDPDSGELYLGDVLISASRAAVQAAAGGHALSDEIQLLVVHGVLHLLGYDNTEPEGKARMWSLQAEILKRLGCKAKLPTA